MIVTHFERRVTNAMLKNDAAVTLLPNSIAVSLVLLQKFNTK